MLNVHWTRTVKRCLQPLRSGGPILAMAGIIVEIAGWFKTQIVIANFGIPFWMLTTNHVVQRTARLAVRAMRRLGLLENMTAGVFVVFATLQRFASGLFSPRPLTCKFAGPCWKL